MTESHYVPPTGNPEDLPKASKSKAPNPTGPAASSSEPATSAASTPPPAPAKAPVYRSYADELKAKRDAAAKLGLDPNRANLESIMVSKDTVSKERKGPTPAGCAIGCAGFLILSIILTGGLAMYAYVYLWPFIALVFIVLAGWGLANAVAKSKKE